MPRQPISYTTKVSNRNTRKKCEIYSKLTIKTYFTPFSSVSIVGFEQLNVSCCINYFCFNEIVEDLCKTQNFTLIFYEK